MIRVLNPWCHWIRPGIVRLGHWHPSEGWLLYFQHLMIQVLHPDRWIFPRVGRSWHGRPAKDWLLYFQNPMIRVLTPPGLHCIHPGVSRFLCGTSPRSVGLFRKLIGSFGGCLANTKEHPLVDVSLLEIMVMVKNDWAFGWVWKRVSAAFWNIGIDIFILVSMYWGLGGLGLRLVQARHYLQHRNRYILAASFSAKSRNHLPCVEGSRYTWYTVFTVAFSKTCASVPSKRPIFSAKTQRSKLHAGSRSPVSYGIIKKDDILVGIFAQSSFSSYWLVIDIWLDI